VASYNSDDINKAVTKIEALLLEEPDLSPSLKASIEMLLLVVNLLANKTVKNSRNSSVPPSADPNRKKDIKPKSDKKPGGQFNHIGSTLQKNEHPDEVEYIHIDTQILPVGNYIEDGFESRQVVDIKISRVVTEYRAQILKDEKGNRFVAQFPDSISRPIQYGASVKENSVYMSMFQLIPYERIRTHFAELFDIQISAGSLYNFNREAYDALSEFDKLAKFKLAHSDIMHVDETGINISGKRLWLHGASNLHWSYFYPHEKRGCEAMNEINIIPNFNGVLCHDHWKPYYKYSCLHTLCNAHHFRELIYAYENDNQKWAKAMHTFLETLNIKVKKNGGILNQDQQNKALKAYRKILKQGEKESPKRVREKSDTKKGKMAQSKSRNLLDRLINYESDTLRFMTSEIVPFTNNQGERDIRMTKVQQKISGCFRSMDGAKTFCLIRSYLSTCKKNNVQMSNALGHIFSGTWPEFIQIEFDQMKCAE